MGKITVTEEEYNERKEKGAVVKMCDEYWRGDHQQGQGALYSICYSVGLENWALPANKASQDRFVIQEGWAAYIVNRSNQEVLDYDEEDQPGDGPDVITRPKGVSVSQRWFLNRDGSIINMKNQMALYPACALGGPVSDKHIILFQYFGELSVTSFDFGLDGIISNCEYLPTVFQVDAETKKVSLEVEDYEEEQLWNIEYIPKKNIEIFKQVVISFVVSEEQSNVPFVLQIDPTNEPGEVNVWAKPENGTLTAAHTWFLYKDGTIASWMNGKLLTFDDDGGTPNQINVVARGQVFTPDPPDNQKFDCFANGLISSRVCGKVLEIDPELGDGHYNIFLNDEYEEGHTNRGRQVWRIEYF